MPTILIAEDSRTMRMCLASALSLQGYTVVEAEDGQQALSKIQAGLKPDLLITDINMPVMNGFELMAQARKTLRFLPILVLSTESESDKLQRAKQLGATGWMVKPVPTPKLLQAIERVLPLAKAA